MSVIIRNDSHGSHKREGGKTKTKNKKQKKKVGEHEQANTHKVRNKEYKQ